MVEQTPYCLRSTTTGGACELQALVAPNPPQVVLVRGQAGLVLDELSYQLVARNLFLKNKFTRFKLRTN